MHFVISFKAVSRNNSKRKVFRMHMLTYTSFQKLCPPIQDFGIPVPTCARFQNSCAHLYKLSECACLPTYANFAEYSTHQQIFRITVPSYASFQTIFSIFLNTFALCIRFIRLQLHALWCSIIQYFFCKMWTCSNVEKI